MTRLPLVLLLLLLLLVAGVPPLPGQGCSGRGNARLDLPVGDIGAQITVAAEGAPGSPLLWVVDTRPGNLPLAGGGAVCLAFSPDATTIVDGVVTGATIPATGRYEFAVLLPSSSSLAGTALYSQVAVADPLAPMGFAVSEPKSLFFHIPSQSLPTLGGLPGFGTGLHAATPFGPDERYVLVSGGGTGNLLGPTPGPQTIVYDNYTRDFVNGPTMQRARVLHTATRLQDGRILIVGGLDGAAVSNWDDGEVYDPATGTLTPVPNPMAIPRGAHTATLLDDGRVLIAGGNQIFAQNPSILPIFQTALDSTTIYDPTTGLFSPGPTMTRPRVGHSAKKLPDGRVLLVGGIDGGIPVSPTLAAPTYAPDAEIFDPVTNAFTSAGNLFSPRMLGQLEFLPSGDLLYAGGVEGILLSASSSAETWSDIGGGIWVPTPNMPRAAAVAGSTVLDDGRVALLGGATGALANFTAGSAIQVFDESTRLWSLETPLPSPRMNHSVNRLDDGLFLVTGGADAMGFAVTTAELWNPF